MAQDVLTAEKAFGSYADWMRSPTAAPMVAEGRVIGAMKAGMFRLRLTEVFSDPPTPDLSLHMATAGSYELTADVGFGRFYRRVRPGDFGVAPADIPVELSGGGRSEVLVLALPWESVRPIAEAAANRAVADFGVLHTQMRRDDTVEQLMRLLWRESATNGAMGTLFADGIMASLIVRLLQLSETSLPAPSRMSGGLSPADLRRVTDYIGDRLAGDVSLDALASLVALSPFHFCRLFKQSTGDSPHQYVIRERVERARCLLLRGGITAAEVAVAVGFTDQSHLILHMKKRLGVTPGALLRAR